MTIPPSWRVTTVEELCTYYSGGEPFRKLEYSATGIPVLAKGDIKPFGRIVHSEKRFISTELAQRQGFRLTQAGDFLLTTRDLTQAADVLGLVAPIPTDRHYVVNQGANTIRLNDRVDARFFIYWTNGPVYRKHIKAHFVGSTQIHLRKQDFLDAPIYLPLLPEQRAIAHILGALDDKIELNRRMNETLEAMASATFKSWFVDFDPIRAKVEGREPAGVDAATAALFPDGFEDSELGEVPTGWRIASVTECMAVNPVRRLASGTVAPYLDMQNMPTSGHRPGGCIHRAFGSGMRFTNGDTLVARITPCLENGKTAFVDFLADGEIGWGSTEFIILRPNSPLPPEFAYYLARGERFRSFAISNMTGSSGRQRVPADSLANFYVTVPSASVAASFASLTQPLMAKIKANSEQSRTLAAIRDALLPKLLSGEIRVKEAEQMVAEEV